VSAPLLGTTIALPCPSDALICEFWHRLLTIVARPRADAQSGSHGVAAKALRHGRMLRTGRSAVCSTAIMPYSCAGRIRNSSSAISGYGAEWAACSSQLSSTRLWIGSVVLRIPSARGLDAIEVRRSGTRQLAAARGDRHSPRTLWPSGCPERALPRACPPKPVIVLI
jgi:hypothetical protein